MVAFYGAQIGFQSQRAEKLIEMLDQQQQHTEAQKLDSAIEPMLWSSAALVSDLKWCRVDVQ